MLIVGLAIQLFLTDAIVPTMNFWDALRQWDGLPWAPPGTGAGGPRCPVRFVGSAG